MADTVVVVAGGSPPSSRALEAIPAGASVVAADGGADHALAVGLEVELAIGDFDSATPEALKSAGHTERHPVDKDATDLELALRAALAWQPRRILVVGGIEGRLDHLLGELLVLGAEELAGVEVDAVLGDALVHVIRDERVLSGTEGELISLFASTARQWESKRTVSSIRCGARRSSQDRAAGSRMCSPRARRASRWSAGYCSQCDPR